MLSKTEQINGEQREYNDNNNVFCINGELEYLLLQMVCVLCVHTAVHVNV